MMSPPTICHLVELCLSSTYFQFQSNLYEQVEGAPMGSPLSPVLADIYMEHFEQLVHVSSPHLPSLWLRYVDDTFVIWGHGEKLLKDFLLHINSLRPSIQFTMELEQDGRLPFLDVLVIRSTDSVACSTSIYRKPTHTDLYLNYKSNHHPRIKTGIIKCLTHRAQEVCTPCHLPKELDHLKSVFSNNGYPSNTVNSVIKSMTTHSSPTSTTQIQQSQPSTDKPKILVLPFVDGLYRQIERICKPLDIQPVFTSRRTLRSVLMNVKQRPTENKMRGVVYKVDCDCGYAYIGETGRTLNIRLKEHQRAVAHADEKNGIAVHANTYTKHTIQWDSAHVLDREEVWLKRRVKESLRIRDEQLSMNLDQGLILNPLWSALH